jgi:2-polyprenyl-3-methyl-5-hydroxy-6-metoxy-1,4-benzoquinol methylase
MDPKTLDAYSKLADEYSKDWHAQPEPKDMYDLIEKFFVPGGDTADIGCGNGRDANWLSQNGFKVCGFDSSKELLQLATHRFPHLQFRQAFLPKLSEVTGKYDNVLCETVIMHLQKDQLVEAIKNLKWIIREDGILYLSWRVTEGEDFRNKDGRLYSAFEPGLILEQFPKESLLHFEDVSSVSSGKRICRLIHKAL